MNKQEYMDVGLRLFGIWSLLQATNDLCTGINVLFGSYSPNSVTANAFITHTCFWALCGIILILKGNKISDLIYNCKDNGENKTISNKTNN